MKVTLNKTAAQVWAGVWLFGWLIAIVIVAGINKSHDAQGHVGAVKFSAVEPLLLAWVAPFVTGSFVVGLYFLTKVGSPVRVVPSEARIERNRQQALIDSLADQYASGDISQSRFEQQVARVLSTD